MSGMSLRRLRGVAIAMGLSCAMATAAHALPMTYTVSGTATGTLGLTSFTNAAFVVSAFGETTYITSLGAGVPCNDLWGVTYTISGVGSGTITSPLNIAANNGRQLLGLAVGTCGDSGLLFMSGYDSKVSTYNLAKAIGPVTLALPSPQFGVDPDTSDGALTIANITSMTFQATAGAAIAPAVGLWWNPSESGSGYNFDVKNGVLVVTIFSYKANGDPQWYIASGPIVDNTFTGTINKYTGGQCISCVYKGLPTSAGNDGVVGIEFTSSTSATLSLPGGRVTRIQPQTF